MLVDLYSITLVAQHRTYQSITPHPSILPWSADDRFNSPHNLVQFSPLTSEKWDDYFDAEKLPRKCVELLITQRCTATLPDFVEIR